MATSIVISSVLWSPMGGSRVLWISPNWLLDVFLEVRHIVLRVLDVLRERLQSLLVAHLSWVADSEWTVLRLLRSWDDLVWELHVASVGGSPWVKCSVLFDSALEWTSFVQDKLSSSLVVQASHVFLSLVGILDIWNEFLERAAMSAGGAVLERLKWWSWLFVVELFHMLELRLLHQLSSAAWGKGSS